MDVNVSQRRLSCLSLPSPQSRRKSRCKRSNELFSNMPSTYATHTRIHTHTHTHPGTHTHTHCPARRRLPKDKHTCNNTYKHAYLCTPRWPLLDARRPMPDGRWMTLRHLGGLQTNLNVPRPNKAARQVAKSRRNKPE